MTSVRVDQLDVTYRSRREIVHAVAGCSFEAGDGDFIVILGPSGCGKSTALNAIAGLVTPTAGTIELGGKTLFGTNPHVNVPPEKRGIGMVFQSYALWPHWTVRKNVAFPVANTQRGLDRKARDAAVRRALEAVHCEGLAERHPGELSGGQQQRIALARAVVAEPQLLLLDEPLSNLDAGLRRALQAELSALHARLGFTAIHVTHDQAEAFALATRIIVMRAGKVEQEGTPRALYERPVSAYVAEFLNANIVAGIVTAGNGDAATIETAFGTFRSDHAGGVTGSATVAMYADRIRMTPDESGRCRLRKSSFVGNHFEHVVDTDGAPTPVTVRTGLDVGELAPGSRVSLSADPDCVFVYPLDDLDGPEDLQTNFVVDATEADRNGRGTHGSENRIEAGPGAAP